MALPTILRGAGQGSIATTSSTALALQEGNFTDAKKQRILDKLKRHAGKDRPFAAMKRFYLKSWGLLAA